MSLEQKNYVRKYKRKKVIVFSIQVLLVLIFLGLWEYLSDRKIINAFIFSAPSKIVKVIMELYVKDNLFQHIWVTLKEVLISFGLGFVLSMILAIIFYSFDMVYKIFDPFITMLNTLPKVAIGPLILIWCGANIKSVIIMALLINLIVSVITIYTGFRKVSSNHLLLFKSFGASKVKTLWYLVIPSSINSIISSLKLNISMSFIGVIMGEFLVSKEGVGYLIIYGTQVFNLDLVLAGVLILVVLSYVLYKPISLIEKYKGVRD